MLDFLRRIGTALRLQIQMIKVYLKGYFPSGERQTFNMIGTCVRRGELKHLDLKVERCAMRMIRMPSQPHVVQPYLKYITAEVMGLETVNISLLVDPNPHYTFGARRHYTREERAVSEAVKELMLRPPPPVLRKWTPARFPKSMRKRYSTRKLRRNKSRPHTSGI
jgi:hypothetical protein